MNQLTICNMALANISQEAITSIDADQAPAIACKLYYDIVRDQLLRKYPWRFARKVAELVVTATEPINWELDYDPPADALRILSVIPEGGTSLAPVFVGDELQYLATGQEKTPYEIVGTQIQTNLGGAYAIYTKTFVTDTDEDLFSDPFVEVFAWKLAFYIAMPITGKYVIRDKADAEFRKAWTEATGVNSSESHIPRDQAATCSIIQARR